jgi:hypothetical protein
MQGGDAGHQAGIVAEGAQVVGGDDLRAGCGRQDGGIVAGAG